MGLRMGETEARRAARDDAGGIALENDVAGRDVSGVASFDGVTGVEGISAF